MEQIHEQQQVNRQMLKATGRNVPSGIAITACVGAGGTQPKLCPPQMASPAAEKYRKTTQGERKH